MGTIISIMAGRPQLEQQARAALIAHYTKKGLKGDELTQTVDRCMAVQFKPLPECPYAWISRLNQEQLQKAIADMELEIEETKRETADALREMELLNQSIN
jgi:hypothetical protein